MSTTSNAYVSQNVNRIQPPYYAESTRKNIFYAQEMTLTEETVEQVYWKKKLTTNILPIQGAYEKCTLCHVVIPWLSYVKCVISIWVESQPQRS